jgi:hypothetical protein
MLALGFELVCVVSSCAMPCSTSANSSGLVLATLDHNNLPL